MKTRFSLNVLDGAAPYSKYSSNSGSRAKPRPTGEFKQEGPVDFAKYTSCECILHILATGSVPTVVLWQVFKYCPARAAFQPPVEYCGRALLNQIDQQQGP